PSTAYRVRKFVRRHRGSLFAAAVVMVAVAAGVVGTAWQAVRATQERDAKQRALDQSRLLAADLAFDKGQLLGERGEADLALLWLARGLRLVPADAAELEAAVRTNLAAWRRKVNSVRLALPHERDIHEVGFTPDGTLVTTSWDRATWAVTVRRWDRATGRPSSELRIAAPAGLGARVMTLSPGADRHLIEFSDNTDGV